MKRTIKTPLLLAALIAAGCGGGTSSGVPTTAVTGHTDLNVNNGTAPTTTDNSQGTAPATTTVTVDNTPTTAAVLPGDTVSQGDDVVLVPTLFPFNVTAPNRAPLDVWYKVGNGEFRDSGFRVNNGHLIPNGNNGQQFQVIALSYPASGESRTITLRVYGALTVSSTSNGNSGNSLNVQDYLDYQFVISNNGALGTGQLTSIPTAVDYNIPANGSTMFGKTIDLTFTGQHAPATLQGTLSIVYATGEKHQTRFLGQSVANKIRFDDLTQDSSDRIPNNGIDHATITTGPSSQ